jgi:hypothetical protein
LSVDELIAFVIRSAYDKFPHALRLDEFFFDADDGVGGIPVNKSDINSFFKHFQANLNKDDIPDILDIEKMRMNNCSLTKTLWKMKRETFFFVYVLESQNDIRHKRMTLMCVNYIYK